MWWVYIIAIVLGLCAGYAVYTYMMHRHQQTDRYSEINTPIVTVEDLKKYEDQ
jgi:hypothetical protein